YPKQQTLFRLKERDQSTAQQPLYGCRVRPKDVCSTLVKWILRDKLQFDVVMIGTLAENQFIYPLLAQLPIHKLCSKAGSLFIWASAQKIQELSSILNSASWSKQFRRSEELVFMAIGQDSPLYPGPVPDSTAEPVQWHCWMCVTQSAKMSLDYRLVNCHIDTTSTVSSSFEPKSCIPSQLYKVAESFSTKERRLHIIPSHIGGQTPIKLRPGWVILAPDVTQDNFRASTYMESTRGL
ncbi:hypothetical protein BABINDRAFT_17490, partial [Babjeviella inositovora NRRL Y-12698]